MKCTSSHSVQLNLCFIGFSKGAGVHDVVFIHKIDPLAPQLFPWLNSDMYQIQNSTFIFPSGKQLFISTFADMRDENPRQRERVINYSNMSFIVGTMMKVSILGANLGSIGLV